MSRSDQLVKEEGLTRTDKIVGLLHLMDDCQDAQADEHAPGSIRRDAEITWQDARRQLYRLLQEDVRDRLESSNAMEWICQQREVLGAAYRHMANTGVHPKTDPKNWQEFCLVGEALMEISDLWHKIVFPPVPPRQHVPIGNQHYR